jgi:hypothetical protein
MLMNFRIDPETDTYCARLPLDKHLLFLKDLWARDPTDAQCAGRVHCAVYIYAAGDGGATFFTHDKQTDVEALQLALTQAPKVGVSWARHRGHDCHAEAPAELAHYMRMCFSSPTGATTTAAASHSHS